VFDDRGSHIRLSKLRDRDFALIDRHLHLRDPAVAEYRGLILIARSSLRQSCDCRGRSMLALAFPRDE
jgi:hypothetical protein